MHWSIQYSAIKFYIYMSVHLMCATFCEFAMFSHQLVGYHYTRYFMYNLFFCVVMTVVEIYTEAIRVQ